MNERKVIVLMEFFTRYAGALESINKIFTRATVVARTGSTLVDVNVAPYPGKSGFTETLVAS